MNQLKPVCRWCSSTGILHSMMYRNGQRIKVLQQCPVCRDVAPMKDQPNIIPLAQVIPFPYYRIKKSNTNGR